MMEDKGGPIEFFTWGKYIIRGIEHSDGSSSETGSGKDIRIVGKSVSRWGERKGHRLSPSMITGVYGKGVEVLIIGIGVDGLLECPEEVRSAIYTNGIPELILERTHEACRLYNDIYRSGKKVALLAHGTC